MNTTNATATVTPNDPALVAKIIGEAQQGNTASVTELLAQLNQKAGDVPGAAAMPAAASKKSVRRKKGAHMTTQPQTLSANAPTMATLLEEVFELGKNVAKGNDAQIQFDIKLVSAAMSGTLSLDPNKHGENISDADKMAEAYANGRTKNLIFDPKANNQRKLRSNAKKMIKLGTTPKWGHTQPMEAVNYLISQHQTFKKTPSNSRRLDDPHNALMRFATEQLKRDKIMSNEEISRYCYKKDKEPRTGTELLEGMRKVADKLAIGKVSNCADALPEAKEVSRVITKLLTQIAKQQAPGAQQTTPATAAA